jgi:hypothetical protein
VRPHPDSLRQAARTLRREHGKSLGEIARELPISVSTARRWTLDISLSPAQAEAMHRRTIQPLRQGNAAWCDERRAERRKWQDEGRTRARLSDALHQAGCLLYWAEGAKTRNTVSIGNSDVHLLRLFRRFLRECFEIEADHLTFSVNVYLNNGLSIVQVEEHWLRELSLTRDCLRSHQINRKPAPTSGVKRNKLPYGVGRLSVTKSTWLIQHIYGAIQEYGQFEEPRWLDF